ncbi:MAG: deoxycytidylate deaminase [Alphaproteobacteria bacterium]|nr:deoxycytidylate deaminase [Alphaproteobacteria bacterium]
MPSDPFEHMQAAVDIVGTSPHPTNKIAATLFGPGFSVSRTNDWPEIIREKIGIEVRIGNSSGTLHAETACILAAHRPTEGASLCITDPFCPNCAKNIAEAGIKTIYIDHKGFQKDFIARRADHFTNMSMRICEKAGITVYEIRRKEKRLVSIYEPPTGYVPYDEDSVKIFSGASFDTLCRKTEKEQKNRRFACALATDENGAFFGLMARAHPAIGYAFATDREEIGHPDGKYSFMLEPLNRLLMAAPRRGLRLVEGMVYVNGVPTARELVNFVGAGFRSLAIGAPEKARDEGARAALGLLEEKGVLATSS